jgi:Ras-related protein Rab-18
MENKFIRYRKINVFGSENAGKQTLINSLDINNSYIEYEIDDENSEIITRIICSYSKEENMYFNFCIKQLNDEKKLEKYEIENLLYETELILIIINTEKKNFQNEIDLLNNITSFENDKILILFNQTESNNENNNSLKEFKKQYLKYKQIQISLNINEDINKIKQKLHHKLYEQSSINLNNLVLFEEYTNNSMSQTKKKQQSIIKILILGDSSVGKTSFISRIYSNSFNENIIETIGTDIEEFLVKISNKKFLLSIWDTKGIDKMKSLPMQYYTNTSSFVILYDVNKENSLNDIDYLINEIRENANRCFIYIIGNKIDLNKRVIQKKEAELFALEHKVKYGEISCKTGLNVYEIATNIILDSSELSADATQTFLLSIEKHKNKKSSKNNKKRCC